MTKSLCWSYFEKVYTTHMPRVQIYLTDETYLIYQEIENKSQWVQDKLYELEAQEKHKEAYEGN